MPKRFADKDETKGGNVKPEQTAQKLWQASSLEGNLLYKNPLAVGIHWKIMICHLKRFFMLPRASRRL